MREKQAGNLSENTILWYRRQVGYFVDFLESKGVERMDQLTEDHVRDYRVAARDRTRGADLTGLRSMFSAVRNFILWAVDKGFALPEVGNLEMPKLAPKAIPTFSAEQLNGMLATIAEESRYPERDEAIVLLLLDTGMRVSEMCGIKVNDLRDYSVRVIAKGNVERWLPISPRTRRAIEHWLVKRPELEGDEHHVFITSAYNPMSRCAARELVERIGRRANIEGVRLSPHTLRHTMAFRWLRSGNDAFKRQEMLGHTSLEMTRRHIQQSGEALAEAHARAGPVDDLEIPGERKRGRRGRPKR